MWNNVNATNLHISFFLFLTLLTCNEVESENWEIGFCVLLVSIFFFLWLYLLLIMKLKMRIGKMGFVCCWFPFIFIFLALFVVKLKVGIGEMDFVLTNLKNFQMTPTNGHLHILLGKDDDRQVMVEDKDWVHEWNMVTNNDGNLWVMCKPSLDTNIIITHYEWTRLLWHMFSHSTTTLF